MFMEGLKERVNRESSEMLEKKYKINPEKNPLLQLVSVALEDPTGGPLQSLPPDQLPQKIWETWLKLKDKMPGTLEMAMLRVIDREGTSMKNLESLSNMVVLSLDELEV